jgi:chorismate-pyruvate lyase
LRNFHLRRWFVAGVLCLGAARSFAPALCGQDFPDVESRVARLEALALIQTLNAELLASRSATLTLEKWCADHRMADPPVIRAVRSAAPPVDADAEQRKRLAISAREKVKYRRVQLRCGDAVLSEAENWYVPSRLTSEMNRLLDESETPFGKVVQPLQPYRRTFAATMRWSPMPEGWEMKPAQETAAPVAIPDALFEHRAVLYDRRHRPFAEVREVYQKQVLRFRR